MFLYDPDIRVIYWLMHQWAIDVNFKSSLTFVRGGKLELKQGRYNICYGIGTFNQLGYVIIFLVCIAHCCLNSLNSSCSFYNCFDHFPRQLIHHVLDDEMKEQKIFFSIIKGFSACQELETCMS